MRQSDEDIDAEVEKYKQTLTATQREAFDRISGTVGTRAYAKISKGNMTRALKKIKKNVQKAYPGDSDVSGFEKPEGGETSTGFDMPKEKGEKEEGKKGKGKKGKGKKRKTKKVVLSQSAKDKGVVLGKLQNQPQLPRKVKRKMKVEKRKQEERAPSGREYSRTELREGLGSKRAFEWRKSHGVATNDFDETKTKRK